MNIIMVVRVLNYKYVYIRPWTSKYPQSPVGDFNAVPECPAELELYWPGILAPCPAVGLSLNSTWGLPLLATMRGSVFWFGL